MWRSRRGSCSTRCTTSATRTRGEGGGIDRMPGAESIQLELELELPVTSPPSPLSEAERGSRAYPVAAPAYTILVFVPGKPLRNGEGEPCVPCSCSRIHRTCLRVR